ncbi:hypothetical protein Ciccas_013649 [Cichlidogyrus casuarinus]|uniref:Uncharacterized protein n=1 Tax=Cichlidogyrus casuarinus TaxID=1844966 RepID=A0ABD2PMC7_9PLAT
MEIAESSLTQMPLINQTSFLRPSAICSCGRSSHGTAYVDIITSSPFILSPKNLESVTSKLAATLLKEFHLILDDAEVENAAINNHSLHSVENFRINRADLHFQAQKQSQVNFHDILCEENSNSSDFAQWWIKLLQLNNLYRGPLDVESAIKQTLPTKTGKVGFTPTSSTLWQLCTPVISSCICSGLALRAGSVTKLEIGNVSCPNSLEFALNLVIKMAQMQHSGTGNEPTDPLRNMGPASLAVMENWKDLFLEGRLTYADGKINPELSEAPSFAEELNDPIPKSKHKFEPMSVADPSCHRDQSIWSDLAPSRSGMVIIVDTSAEPLNLNSQQTLLMSAWSEVLDKMVQEGKAIRLSDKPDFKEITKRILNTFLSHCSC